jgi:hypothetical protein
MGAAEGPGGEMHVNRSMLGWGVFFIALGVVPLVVRGGALDAETASRAWELWPLLLIGAGLGLALRGTAFAVAGNIVVGLTFGLICGGIVVGGIGAAPLAFCGTSSAADAGAATSRSGSLGDPATVDLQVDCGSLAATSQPGAEWSIFWPKAASAPKVQTADSSVSIEMGNQHGFAVGNPNAHWTLALPADVAMDLSLEVNAGSAKLALGNARIRSANVSVNAGEAHLDLAAATGTQQVDASVNAGSLSIALPQSSGGLRGTLSTNAGSLRLCAPPNAPLTIHVDESLGSNNFAVRGLVRSGDTWTRGVAGVGGGAIELTLHASLGSVTLDPEDGCG